MGSWGSDPFGGDGSCDWVGELRSTQDWGMIDEAIDAVLDAKQEIDVADGEFAVAASEVIARIAGFPGSHTAFTEDLDAWLTAHPVTLPAALFTDAIKALKRVTGRKSELRELWDESSSGSAEWLAVVKDLQTRLAKAVQAWPNGIE